MKWSDYTVPSRSDSFNAMGYQLAEWSLGWQNWVTFLFVNRLRLLLGLSLWKQLQCVTYNKTRLKVVNRMMIILKGKVPLWFAYRCCLRRNPCWCSDDPSMRQTESRCWSARLQPEVLTTSWSSSDRKSFVDSAEMNRCRYHPFLASSKHLGIPLRHLDTVLPFINRIPVCC